MLVVVAVDIYISKFSLQEASYLVEYLMYISQNNSTLPDFYLSYIPTFIFGLIMAKKEGGLFLFFD